MTLLSVNKLSVRLGDAQVLNDVSLEIAAGEFVGLIGPNGAGKSTLLRAILDLVPHAGQVSINEQSASQLGARQRGQLISFVPQEHEIAWPVSVKRLVALGRTPHLVPFSTMDDNDKAVVDKAMQRMEIEAFAERAATDLSGGEKARTLIARALAQEAPLLLADEPTAGLDPAHQISLMRIFAELTSDGNTVVASLHDLGLAARWCTRLILLDKGCVIADGPAEDVLTPARLRDVYNVEAFMASDAGGYIIQPVNLAHKLMADEKAGNHVA